MIPNLISSVVAAIQERCVLSENGANSFYAVYFEHDVDGDILLP